MNAHGARGRSTSLLKITHRHQTTTLLFEGRAATKSDRALRGWLE